MLERVPFVQPESVEVFVDPGGEHGRTVFLVLKLAGCDKLAVPLSPDWAKNLVDHVADALMTLARAHADKANPPTAH